MGVGLDSPWHWLVLIVVLVALFGARRLPNAAKSLAQSVRIFRSELKGPKEDEAMPTPPTAAAVPPAIPPAAPVPAAPPPAAGPATPAAPPTAATTPPTDSA